jgi:predicted acyl esterase
MLRKQSFVRISLAVALVTGSVVSIASADAIAGRRPSAKSHAMVVRGSAKQVQITGLAGGAHVALLDRAGDRVTTRTADSLGGLVFEHIKPGAGYHVQVLPHGARSAAVTVHSNRSKPWDPKIYHQSIPDKGYGYLTTRDGTKLAYYVHPPTSPAGLGLPPVTVPGGLPAYAPPYPTLIEYSGYGYANPAGPESGIAILANLMGFAVVDVNMRGTGCSGGAYNFFEPLQNLDGYDVIEAVAHQPWVRDHKVGMMGISFGAISQLFTAQTHPPSLEAIAPLSTIDATATTLYPGGVLNDGFAVAWADERQQNAEPATGADRGQAWAYQRIKGGDEVCKDNQVLHGEAQNLPAKIARNSHYRPKAADQLDPITFVHKIHVPVFMACQFEDEQTGGHCPDLAAHFTGTKQKWFTFTNGAHIDSLDPATYDRWYDFLQLFVAHQAPLQNSAVTDAAAPVIFQMAMGLPNTDAVTLPPDPIQLIPTYPAALKAFKKLPSVRVLFDNGACTSPTSDSTPGNPYPGFEHSFAQFPVKHTKPQQWYLGAKGALDAHRAGDKQVDWYHSDASALPLNDFGSNTGGGGLWGNASQWDWKWRNNPTGTAVSYLTAPLKTNTTVFGAGAVHLWVRSSTPNVDLQATVSEVDPNGNETFVQNGWLRASERKLATGRNNVFKQKSTLLEPIPSLLTSDARPMPKGKFVKVVIPLYYEGHAYRAGSRIRVTISAPNGTQPIWSFQHTEPKGTAKVSIAHSKTMPSSLILPVVPGVAVPTALPPCPSLRNEPCRRYRRLVNRTAVR